MKKIIKLLFLFSFFSLTFLKIVIIANSASAITNPLGSTSLTPQLLAGRIISAVLGIVGSIALIMFISGGFKWMTAGGNEEKIKRGKDTLVWATLGLIVIFAAYAMLKFIFEALVPAT